jgi:hypothetical protein
MWLKLGQAVEEYRMLHFANEGFIMSATNAVVGDRPGGEYVVGATKMDAKLDGIAKNTGDALPCLLNLEENTQETSKKLNTVDSNICRVESAVQAMGYNIVASMAGVWGGNSGSGGRYGSFFGGGSWLSGGAAGVGAGWDYEPDWGGEAASDYLASFAEGGFISKPTVALVGDSQGGEWLVPNDDMDTLINGILGDVGGQSGGKMSVSADLRDADDAINSWRDNLAKTPVKIPLQADLMMNTEEVRMLLVAALKKIVKEVR